MENAGCGWAPVVAIVTVVGICLALGTAASWIVELLSALMHWRAKTLVGVMRGAHDESSPFVNGLLHHSLVKGPGGQLPAYVSQRDVTVAALDVMGLESLGNAEAEATAGAAAISAVTHQRPAISSHPRPVDLFTLLPTAKLEPAEKAALAPAAAEAVERWFRACVAESTASYRRNTMWALAVVGFALAFLFNIDTIYIVQSTARAAQSASVAQLPVGWRSAASESAPAANPSPAGSPGATPRPRLIPMGPDDEQTPHSLGVMTELPLKLLGFLITALGTAMAGTFVFDLLSRWVVVRLDAPAPDEVKKDSASSRLPEAKP